MIDVATHKPIRVLTPELTPPDIDASRDQLDKVLELLEAHRIPHWAEHLEISFNNGPFMLRIHLHVAATGPVAGSATG